MGDYGQNTDADINTGNDSTDEFLKLIANPFQSQVC